MRTRILDGRRPAQVNTHIKTPYSGALALVNRRPCGSFVLNWRESAGKSAQLSLRSSTAHVPFMCRLRAKAPRVECDTGSLDLLIGTTTTPNTMCSVGPQTPPRTHVTAPITSPTAPTSARAPPVPLQLGDLVLSRATPMSLAARRRRLQPWRRIGPAGDLPPTSARKSGPFTKRSA